MVDTGQLERQALSANDIRVLVEQLNEALKRGAQNGLEIKVAVSGALEFDPVTYYPELTLQILGRRL